MADRSRRRVRALLASAAAAVVLVAGPLAAQEPDPGPQLRHDPPAGAEEARARASEILARDEYQAPREGGRNVLQRLADWVGDRLPDLDVPAPGGRSIDVASLAVVGVIAVGVVAVLVWVLAGVRRSRRPGDDGGTDAEVEVTPLRTAPEWDAEADRLAGAGDHRGAVRARFRALVATLARRDLVADTPGRTAGELRGDVAERAPSLAPAFDAAADHFEAVWFGGAPAGPDDSARARELAARARDAAPRRPEVAAEAGA